MNEPEPLTDSMIVTSRPQRVEPPSGFRLSSAALAMFSRGPTPLRDADFHASPRRFLGSGRVSMLGEWRDPSVDIVDPRVPRVNEARTASRDSATDVGPW